MLKATNLQGILILGSRPIVIGRATEFDYSGTQAVRALREEGYRVFLSRQHRALVSGTKEAGPVICGATNPDQRDEGWLPLVRFT